MKPHWLSKELLRENGRRTSANTLAQNVARYEASPLECTSCGSKLSYKARKNKFCSRSCAAQFNNLGRIPTEAHKQRTSLSLSGHNKSPYNKKLNYSSIQELYDSGLSIKETATHFGISESALRRAHKNGKLVFRTRSQVSKLAIQKRGGLVTSREASSLNRRRQLATEEALADKLRSEGYEIFSPTVVCDRIGIKDGKVYFVEFKPRGQELRQGQATVCDLVPDQYHVEYYDMNEYREVAPWEQSSTNIE